MTRETKIHPTESYSQHLNDVKQIFASLNKEDIDGSSGFSANKNDILKLFEDTAPKDHIKSYIFVRLALIDNIYSTQMNKRYYALDELAETLSKIANGKAGKLRQLFIDFTKDPDNTIKQFNYTSKDRDGNDIETNLFSNNYGISKDGKDKGAAISLISKYAYFDTAYNFPIYDSVAYEMFPLVWTACGFGEKEVPQINVSQKGKILGKETMVKYINGINALIMKLNIETHEKKYDHLDRLLWFVGKIRRGNLSLVLTKEQYLETLSKCRTKEVKYTTKKGKEKTYIEYYFNIDEVDLEQLDFLKQDNLLFKFFLLAKYYGHKK
ncbi:MAG: hypothetical protein IKT74_08510 [Bacteroidales bacterium]|nr:hypothetical protein [Bacteroidales bacterium]